MAHMQRCGGVPRMLAALAVALALGACSGSVGIGFGGYWGDGGWWDDGWDEVGFGVIDSRGRSGIATPGLQVARDLSGWSALWQAHVAPDDPASPLPSVNFANRMVAGVFAGQRASSCARIRVTRVLRERATGRLHIDAALSLDGGACSQDSEPSTPAELVALEQTSAEVTLAVNE